MLCTSAITAWTLLLRLFQIPVKNVHKLSGDPVLLHQFIEYLKSLHVVDLLILFRQLGEFAQFSNKAAPHVPPTCCPAEEINSQVLQPDIPLAVKETIRRDLLVLLECFLHSPALQLLDIPQEFYSDVRAGEFTAPKGGF